VLNRAPNVRPGSDGGGATSSVYTGATSDVHTQPDRQEGNWRGWLFTTAQREAWRQTALETGSRFEGGAD